VLLLLPPGRPFEDGSDDTEEGREPIAADDDPGSESDPLLLRGRLDPPEPACVAKGMA
jgi:hypothetical protein